MPDVMLRKIIWLPLMDSFSVARYHVSVFARGRNEPLTKFKPRTLNFCCAWLGPSNIKSQLIQPILSKVFQNVEPISQLLWMTYLHVLGCRNPANNYAAIGTIESCGIFCAARMWYLLGKPLTSRQSEWCRNSWPEVLSSNRHCFRVFRLLLALIFV